MEIPNDALGGDALGLGEVVATALVAALPALAVSIWAWFKAHAAQSPETWDDRVVGFIEEVVRRSRDDSRSFDVTEEQRKESDT